MPRMTNAQEMEATVTVIRRLAREKKARVEEDPAAVSVMTTLNQMVKAGELQMPLADAVLRFLTSLGETPVAAASNGNGRTGAKAPEVQEPGLYKKDGKVYLVQRSADGSRTYALLFQPGARKELDKATGKIYDLKPADKVKGQREIDRILGQSAKLATSYRKAVPSKAA